MTVHEHKRQASIRNHSLQAHLPRWGEHTIGRQEILAGRHAGSVPFFERAIELDPNFAVAHSALADVDENAEESARQQPIAAWALSPGCCGPLRRLV